MLTHATRYKCKPMSEPHRASPGREERHQPSAPRHKRTRSGLGKRSALGKQPLLEPAGPSPSEMNSCFEEEEASARRVPAERALTSNVVLSCPIFGCRIACEEYYVTSGRATMLGRPCIVHAAACWPAVLPAAQTRARVPCGRWLCRPHPRLSAGSRSLLRVRAAASRPAVADAEQQRVALAEAQAADVDVHSEVLQHSCVSLVYQLQQC